ncbi:MAG: tRNA (adenosine(37)-N6)-threonylcarbamoyltransferase complex dimerization subunit type 1 TsaB [Lactobacillus sp.]|nr:tRNA (adenosine(37)-N6)-threonylcarbamoyltransferase complex dimerization subunit type 1 TsaB [Lactobacillus sp.]
MKILSVTTATNFLSVAVTDNDQVIIQKEEQDKRNHSEHLAPLIDEMLKESQLKLADFDGFAVTQGPGSYTGLRIGMTTIKMFAKALDKPVCGLSTLEVMAHNATDDLVVALIDARNHNYFAGAYQDGENVIPDGHYDLDELLTLVAKIKAKSVTFVGTYDQAELSEKVANAKFISDNDPHAATIGLLAQDKKWISADALLPAYLRRTQAEVDWHKKTGKPYEADSTYVEEVD